MTNLSVELGERSYPIEITAGSLESLPRFIKDSGDPGQVAIIADSTVAELYSRRVQTILKVAGINHALYTFPAGEEAKNIHQYTAIMTWLIENQFKRDDLILALGGGVTGDLAGFAAATYLRGVPFAQIPTTLLSQVDSSVGGKTGINHTLGKNLIGAFYQPKFVLIDPTVLSTLEPREMWAGLGEVVKYSLIVDVDFFHHLENKLLTLTDISDTADLEDVIARCCEIKATVVQEDEQEAGLRQILNFGHTLGHALETEAGYGTMRHGEAIMYGMHWAGWISHQKGYLDIDELSRITALLKRLKKPVLPEGISAANLTARMAQDKKQSDSGLTWVLLKSIGTATIELAYDIEEFTEGWIEHVQKSNI